MIQQTTIVKAQQIMIMQQITMMIMVINNNRIVCNTIQIMVVVATIMEVDLMTMVVEEVENRRETICL